MKTSSRLCWVLLAACLGPACATAEEGEVGDRDPGFAGSTGTGGDPVGSVGGSLQTGGGSATGGVFGTGGASTGGASSGGASSGGADTGGASGGSSATGGSSTGGAASTGGTTGAGGTPGTGGTASTGGAVGTGGAGSGGGSVGSCTPDVASYSQGRCGLTAVHESKLYECQSQAAGVLGEPTGCGTGGVYCSQVEPTDAAWGSTAWKYLQDCE